MEHQETGSAEQTQPLPAEEAQGQQRKVRARAFVVAFALMPLNVYWIIAAEIRWYLPLTLNPLFVTPVFWLALLAGLNALLRHFAPKLVFRPTELVVIYVMLVVSCTMATHDYIINLMSIMGWPAWIASPENKWESLLFPYLPKSLFVWDMDILKGFFNGGSSLYEWKVIKTWLPPLGVWSLFIFSMGFTFFCLNVLLRKMWTEYTKLSFPIIRLPLALTEHPSDFAMLKTRMFWMGFSLAGVMALLNGLNVWYPGVPHLSVLARYIQFATPPWSAMGSTPYTIYPFCIGLGFLLPLDVAFSCWFFMLFIKLQMLLGYVVGVRDVPDFPYTAEQQMGAWYTFGLILLYGSRHHLKDAFHAVFRRDGSDIEEAISYRLAFWGVVFGIVFFLVFWVQVGFSLIWAIVALVTYLLVSLTITRIRAEAGAQHTVWDLEPAKLFRLFDSRSLGPSNLTAGALSHWYWRLNRSHLMPAQLEAMKLAMEHKMPLRSLRFPLLAAFALAVILSMWACLDVLYKDGALAKCQGFAVWCSYETFDTLRTSMDVGFKMQPARWVAATSAGGLTLLLTWLRSRFVWFPFHPLGYCVGPWAWWFWFPFFIAWLVKKLILRYGGLKVYKQALPFFLGLILGDYGIGAIWSLIGVFWQVPVMRIFH